ncbi:MAG: hypothetical protein CVU39_06625 [Chloroflexi bacterium HGW-Chloroflexi-10]|nr:MAG: hypothetical protein CVU39_06625 [Chloroflexi bacterium HGW-Chloroflexi-10]
MRDRIKQNWWLGLLLLLPVMLLMGWSFRQFSWADLTAIFLALHAGEIAILLFINIAIFSLFTVRWQILLVSMGAKIGFYSLLAYRLVSFGISYFTPGPQFGGEPAQVVLLKQKHGLPTEMALSSVYLDRIIDLLVNLSVLVIGFFWLLAAGIMEDRAAVFQFWWVVLLVSLPAAHLFSLYFKKLPFSALLEWIGYRSKSQRVTGWARVVHQSEARIGEYVQTRPQDFLKVLVVAAATWGLMILEYAVLLQFLGLELPLTGVWVAVIAARLAFLTPLPGGLGALEAAQVAAMQLLQVNPAFGIGAAVIIRLRDVIFGCIGLGFGLWLLNKKDSIVEVKS